MYLIYIIDCKHLLLNKSNKLLDKYSILMFGSITYVSNLYYRLYASLIK